jgi:hypothetical protein
MVVDVVESRLNRSAAINTLRLIQYSKAPTTVQRLSTLNPQPTRRQTTACVRPPIRA